MKFQLKTLVAAVALIGATGSAFAAIPSVNAATGSELLFYVFDGVAKKSFTLDLGQTYASFKPGTSAAASDFSFSMSNYATPWNAYVASIGGDFSNTTWGVVAGNNVAANNGGKGFLTTVQAGADTSEQTSNAAQSGVGGPLKVWIDDLNVKTGIAGVNLANGYFTDKPVQANITTGFGINHTGAGKFSFVLDNAIGTDSEFRTLNMFGSGGTATITQAAYANVHGNSKFSFDGNNLKYTVAVAAIPEPSSYAMMLAGLMLVAGVARRRHLNK
jgi:hypothetical protein